jgi:hypothetical protein
MFRLLRSKPVLAMAGMALYRYMKNNKSKQPRPATAPHRAEHVAARPDTRPNAPR